MGKEIVKEISDFFELSREFVGEDILYFGGSGSVYHGDWYCRGDDYYTSYCFLASTGANRGSLMNISIDYDWNQGAKMNSVLGFEEIREEQKKLCNFSGGTKDSKFLGFDKTLCYFADDIGMFGGKTSNVFMEDLYLFFDKYAENVRKENTSLLCDNLGVFYKDGVAKDGYEAYHGISKFVGTNCIDIPTDSIGNYESAEIIEENNEAIFEIMSFLKDRV